MNLKRLVDCAPSGEPLVRVYDRKIVLNAEAVKLLSIEDGDPVVVWNDRDRGNRIYISRGVTGDPRCRKRINTAEVFSIKLARAMSDTLSGEGVYRIERENAEESRYGTVWPVFHKYEGQ